MYHNIIMPMHNYAAIICQVLLVLLDKAHGQLVDTIRINIQIKHLSLNGDVNCYISEES